MKVQMKIKKISFSSYIKLFVVTAIPFGLLMGLLSFFISLIGGDAKANFGSTTLTGVPAGIALIFIFPFVYTILAIIVSLVTYLPFRFTLNYFKGLNIEGEFEIKGSSKLTEPSEESQQP